MSDERSTDGAQALSSFGFSSFGKSGVGAGAGAGGAGAVFDSVFDSTVAAHPVESQS